MGVAPRPTRTAERPQRTKRRSQARTREPVVRRGSGALLRPCGRWEDRAHAGRYPSVPPASHATWGAQGATWPERSLSGGGVCCVVLVPKGRHPAAPTRSSPEQPLPLMTWSMYRSYQSSRSHSHRLLPGHALGRVRRNVLPIFSAAPAERKARQAVWFSGHVLRSHRTRIANRFTLAISLVAMILALLFSTQSLNPLERAQTAQTAKMTQVAEYAR